MANSERAFMTIEGASRLHQELCAAIETKDVNAFDSLLRRHWAEIVAEFDSWVRVPAAIRDDQESVSRYVQSLIAIAQAFEALGEPALIERLHGPDETNPVVRWQRALRRAQASTEAGEYDDSSELLKQILVEMEGMTGSAVADLRPRVLGRLGFNASHKKDYAAALDYTKMAYEACLSAGDEEGCVTYYESMMSLQAIQALHAEPERGRHLLHARGLIAQAQDLADAGRYQASKQKLSQALSVIQSQNDDKIFRALLPKVYGLLGFNEYKLGNASKARERTSLALKESETIGDAHGVRIYTANLEAIDSR